jgi:hypothetical protein
MLALIANAVVAPCHAMYKRWWANVGLSGVKNNQKKNESKDTLRPPTGAQLASVCAECATNEAPV